MSAHMRIAEIAAILHPRSSRWRALALGRAFFDETGTDKKSSIVAIGGFVGVEAAWSAIEPRFQSILEDFSDRGVTSLHTTDALAQEGQFRSIDKPRLDYIITNVSKTLGAGNLTAFFSAVSKRDWSVVDDPKFMERFKSPIDLCFESVIQNLWKWAKKYAEGELIVPMFAYEKKLNARFSEIGRLYGAQEWYRQVLGALAFDYPDRVIGLQAADFLAHQMKWDVERGGETKALLWATNNKLVIGNLFDADGLRRIVARFRDAGYPSGAVDLFSPL